MSKKWLVLLLSSLFMLSACNPPVYNQTENNIADVKLRMAQLNKQSDESAKPAPPLIVKQGAYVDTTPVNLSRQPAWLSERIVLRGDQLPFSYYSRTIAAGAGNNILTKYQTGLDPSVTVSLNYSGTIKGALDLLATKAGYVYSIKGTSIFWQAFVTKTIDVAFMPGGTEYFMGKSASGAGAGASATSSGQVANYTTSDSSDSEYSNLKGTLSVWTDLENTIKQLLSPDGKVVVSQSTTSVTVNDRPSNVALVEQYVGNLNHNLSKQVLVKVQILQVKLSNGFDFGINWDVIAKSFHNSNFVINGNYGTPVSITALTAQNSPLSVPILGSQGNGEVPSYTILFNALNQQGKTSIVSEPRVVCLNNQVSVIRIVSSNGYVASIQNTAGVGTSNTTQNTVTSQVTPGTLITGLTLYILPKIMSNRVYLQVNADLSANDGFTTLGNAGVDPNVTATQIQLPNVTEKHFNQRSMIKSGDTLILSGFRQVGNRTGANQFIESQALGGKASLQDNTDTIVLITPFILNGSA
jgi:type IVB pilus formation R64 PilN family outer membrane protein